MQTLDKNEVRRRGGLYTLSEIARECGVTLQAVRYHLKQGNLHIETTYQIEGQARLYYGREALEATKQCLAESKRRVIERAKALNA